MPARHESEFFDAPDDLVPTSVRVTRDPTGVTGYIEWSPQAEAALVAARASMDVGDDVEAYRLIGLAAAEQTEYDAYGILLGFAVIGTSAFAMGLLIMGTIWALFG